MADRGVVRVKFYAVLVLGERKHACGTWTVKVQDLTPNGEASRAPLAAALRRAADLVEAGEVEQPLAEQQGCRWCNATASADPSSAWQCDHPTYRGGACGRQCLVNECGCSGE